MDGMAGTLERFPVVGAAVTPAKPDVQRELGELASDLAASIAAQREGHDRLRGTLDAYEANLNAISATLNSLERDFAAFKAAPQDVAKIRWTAGVTYSIVVSTLLIAGFIWGLYQNADRMNLANQAAIERLNDRLAADDKVKAAELRLREYKEATQAREVDRIDKLSTLNDIQIRTLQKERR